MGTVVDIDVRFAPALAEMPWSALARARAVLHRADALFSTWRPESPMSRFRRGALELDALPSPLAAVLDAARAAREASGGWFDPWAMPGGVDPTGYVKGWAAQRALDELAAAGVSGALVNAAGDIATCGAPAPGGRWRVGVLDPFTRGAIACVVELTGAIATSGSYERGPHLLDPHTGQPAARVASASVTGPDLGLADALATALAVGGVEALVHLEALAGYEALLIGFDGTRTSSAGFPIVDAHAA